MNRPANIRAAETLDEMRAALACFVVASEEALERFDAEIAHTVAWLQDLEADWRARVRQCQESVDSANEEEEEDVGRVYARLAEAEERLEAVRHTLRQFEDVCDGYRRRKGRFSEFLGEEIPRTTAHLTRLAAALDAYLSLTPPSPSGVLTSNARPTTTNASTSLEGVNGDGRARRQGTPIQYIALADIDFTESYVRGPDDFKKVSYEEVVAGFSKLENAVRPAVYMGANGDYFSRLDSEKGLSYEQGYRRIYDAFYGEDRIVLDHTGGQLGVTNGYHRLFVAQSLGITSVPALVRGAPARPLDAAPHTLEPGAFSSSEDQHEVYFCGHCNRQQMPREGIGCKVCGRRTVSWKLDSEHASVAQSKWKIVNGVL